MDKKDYQKKTKKYQQKYKNLKKQRPTPVPKLNDFFINRLQDFLNQEIKIKINPDVEKKIIDFVHKNPEFRITVDEILFLDINILSQKFIKLITALISVFKIPLKKRNKITNIIPNLNRKPISVGGASNLGVYHYNVGNYQRESFYSQDKGILPQTYKLVNNLPETIKCNNIFDKCDENTHNLGLCIDHKYISNKEKREDCIVGTKCSPEDIISSDIIANSNSNIFMYDKTKTCYDSSMLNQHFDRTLHNPETREEYELVHKRITYIDTLTQQQVDNNYLKSRFNKLTQVINKRPFTALAADLTGVVIMNTIHDVLVHGTLLNEGTFSELPLSDKIQGTLGLISILGVGYYILHPQNDVLQGIVDIEIYKKIHEYIYKFRNEEFNALPHLPEGDVLQMMKDIGVI
jgi:hypothetical protein